MAEPFCYFPQSSRQEQSAHATSTVRKRILFIDDEPNVRVVVQACLENLGEWEVLLAPSGQEGLATVEQEPLDAILLDGMMPEMDGITFLKTLRTHLRVSIPVIFLTAKASLAEPQCYLSLGANGAIAKPFDPLTLAAQIATILNWHND